MKPTYTIAIAIVVIAIIIGSVAAYSYIGSNTTPQATPTPTPVPTATPTATPTVAPSTSPTAHPSVTPTPTAGPTASPSPTPSPTPKPTLAPASLTGAGATFPYPLIDKMITNFTATNTNVQVNYQSVGSGGGITALTEKTVDFGCSDAPLSATEAASIPNSLHIPETIGAVTVAYNLPGVPTGLHLTGKVIADIYQGTITHVE